MKPDLWQDEAVAEVTIPARLTFIGLITQADDHGRLKGDPRLVRSWIFPYDELSIPEVSGFLQELSGEGLIRSYLVDGKPYIELPSWHRHQKVSHPTDSALPSHEEADSQGAPEDSGDFPEDSVRKGREGKGREGKGREGKSAVATADATLSHLLADLVAANDPDGKRPTVTAAWAIEEDRMLRLDNRKPAEARRLIEWTQADTFWRKNVRSMPKFRARYAQLYLAAVEDAEKKRGKGSPGMANAHRLAEKARRMEESAA